MDLPSPCSETDKNTWDSILSVPWLKSSVVATGDRWGRRVADVKMSRLPQNLLGLALLIPSDPEDSQSTPLNDELRLVFYRCDRYDYQGWNKTFDVNLTLPDGSVYEVEVPRSVNIPDGHSIRVPITPTEFLRERKQQVSRSVPRVIYNLSAPLEKQLTQEVRRFLANIRRMTNLVQCTSLYLVIEDEAGTKEVENSGIPGFKEAYAALRSGSFKADMLRYYLLWKYGGVYLDNKTFLRYSLDSAPFDHIFNECDMFVSTSHTAEIAFMGSHPRSPIMLKSLQTAIDNVLQRLYTNHQLGITGNVMFQKTLKELGEEADRILFIPLAKSQEQMMYDDDILWQRGGFPKADWPKPETYYADLWNRREIYTDGNPETVISLGLPAERKREIIAYTLFILAIIGFGFLIAQYPPIQWL